jgi:cell division protein FtsN
LNNEPINNDEFEYNDGLGDMLREKEKPVFSWAKTLIFILIVVLVVIVFFVISFNLGKKIVQKKNSNPIIAQIYKSPLKNRLVALLTKFSNSKKQTPAPIEPLKPTMDVITSDQGITVTNNIPTSSLISTAQVAPVVTTISAQTTPKITTPAPVTITAKPNSIVTPPPATVTEQPIPVVTKPYPMPPVTQKITIPVKKVKKVPKKISAPVQTSATLERPYKVIAGSFSTSANASLFVQELKGKGIKDAFIWGQPTNNTEIYKVQVGAFKTYAEAKKHIKELSKHNIPAFVLQK